MSDRKINDKLIVDIGMSEGNDSDFYVKKGFFVLGVEADAKMYESLNTRFASQIGSGGIKILHRAADEVSGKTVIFQRNLAAQGHSKVLRGQQVPEGAHENIVQVETIGWNEIIGCYGTPYYCKIDIEGSEASFLKGFVGTPHLPVYISAEIHTFEPVELLYQAGYRQFKIINQTKLNSIKMPNPALEGNYVQVSNWVHSSGPFGRELQGEVWFNFARAAVLFDLMLQARRNLQMWDWFDIHAFMPA